MARFRPRFARPLVLLLAAVLVLALWSFHSASAASAAKPAPTVAAASPGLVSDSSPTDPVLIGAGDICEQKHVSSAAATARLIEARPFADVFTLGDNSNQKGTADQYATCYAKTWGQFLTRTHATVGNHDCETANCDPYYAYFGAAAGPAHRGYYSYGLPNEWHVIVLNSQRDQLEGGFGSAQERWLRADLAANSGKHVIAMWHEPAFQAAPEDQRLLLPFWHDLYMAHADLVLNGHHHYYERFAPASPSGRADPSGIRAFIVGTGGSPSHSLGERLPTSEVAATDVFGVLVLTLHRHSYDWEFVPIAGQSFTDSGTAATHT